MNGPRSIRPWSPAPDALLGADSIAWRTAARSWAILGGQRALVLQVADPRIAAGVVDHSDWESDPFGRLVGTLTSMLRLSFASADRARAEEERLTRLHGAVVGVTSEGTPYSGLDPDAQAWVLATLIDSLWTVERRFVGVLDEVDHDRSVQETRRLAAHFAIDPDTFPADLDGFRSWFARRVDHLEPDETSRRVVTSVLDPPGVPRALRRIGAVLTADLLPPAVREAFALRPARPAEVGRILSAQRWSRRVVPRLPGAVTLNPVVIPALLRRPRSTR